MKIGKMVMFCVGTSGRWIPVVIPRMYVNGQWVTLEEYQRMCDRTNNYQRII